MPHEITKNHRYLTNAGLALAIVAAIALPVLGGQLGLAANAILIGALVFAVIHPLVLFALYFTLLFFGDTTFDGALPISLNQVMAPLFFLSVFLYMIRGKTMPIRFSLLPLMLVISAYFLLRALTGQDFDNGLIYGRYVIIYLLLSVCVAILMSTERTILTIAWIIVGITTVFALHGFYEAYEKNLFGGIVAGWSKKTRVVGTAPNPIIYGWNMLYAFPFAFLLFAESASRYTRLIALIFGTLILGAATLTFNRQTYVFIVVALGLSAVLYTYRNRKLLLTLIAAFGGLISLTILPTILKRMFTVANMSHDYSFLERRDSYLMAMEMIRRSPIFGIGFGSYSTVWRDYIPPDYSTYFAQYRGAAQAKYMDMNYVYLFAETGIVGLGLFVALLLTILYRAWKYRKAAVAVGDRFAQNLSSTVIVIAVFIALSSAIQDTFLYVRIWIFYGIAMLLDTRVLPIVQADKTEQSPDNIPSTPLPS